MSDIEDLAKNQETITKVLYQFQQSTSSAYTQMMTAVDNERNNNSLKKRNGFFLKWKENLIALEPE